MIETESAQAVSRKWGWILRPEGERRLVGIVSHRISVEEESAPEGAGDHRRPRVSIAPAGAGTLASVSGS